MNSMEARATLRMLEHLRQQSRKEGPLSWDTSTREGRVMAAFERHWGLKRDAIGRQLLKLRKAAGEMVAAFVFMGATPATVSR
jgi:hypothetical protein